MPNIKSSEMSIALFGIVQECDYSIIDQYWEDVVELLKKDVQPNIYKMVLCLYGAGNWALPARLPKREVCLYFSCMWVRNADPNPHLEVKLQAARGVGWVYYDVVEAGSNGSDNGGATYEYAVERWHQKYGPDCAREQTRLEQWLRRVDR
jgi:hypothetical protein